MEFTVVLLKPDCIQKRLVGEVIRRFEDRGLSIYGCKMFQFSAAFLQEHYAHHLDKPFFPALSASMQSAPVIALVLGGKDAISNVRQLVGPTDSKKAPRGTIRGDHGEDATINVVHASDSREAAAAEMKRFFENEEIFIPPELTTCSNLE